MSTAKEVLLYLSHLKRNNNREWFQENKEWYNRVRADFERLVESLILEIADFDEKIKNLTAKESMFRIYRDIRFSPDKTPYKTYFGAYMAAGGGRKSVRSGYYLHLEPDVSFVSVGVYCPEPAVLKALRQSVYDNIDELNEIRREPDFARYYKDFYEEGKLKKVPREFPADFQEAELLKLKHYLVDCALTEKTIDSEGFIKEIVNRFKAAYSFNRFLNYTVEELMK